MRRVIEMDLVLNRKVILINQVIFLACLAFFALDGSGVPPGAYAGFASFMMAFLPAILVTREDKFRAMVLVCSLPVKRRTVVQARFVLSLALAYSGILVAFLFGVLLPGSVFGMSDLFAWRPALTGFTGVSLVLSILLPFTLRFGMKGILVFLVAAQVLGVVLLTLVQTTGSSVDRMVVGKIVGFFQTLHGTLGTVGLSLTLVAFLIALLGLSYLVSVRVFEGREL